KPADPELGTLNVLEHGDVSTGLLRRSTNPVEALTMGLAVTVREIESGNVHSGPTHVADGLVRVGCRSQGGDDLGPSHAEKPSWSVAIGRQLSTSSLSTTRVA